MLTSSQQAHGLLLMAHALLTAASPSPLPSETHTTLTATQAAQLPALVGVVQSRVLWTLPGAAPAAIKRDATRMLATLCTLPLAEPCVVLQGLKGLVKQTCQACLVGYV